MRCISILYVIWHHTNAGIHFELPMFHRGFLGVDMFFMISGFLITTLLLREKERNKKISLKDFFIRRFLRIFPIYYALLAAVAFAVTFIRTESSMREPFFSDLPYYATFTSNWHEGSTFLDISWSLASEEQFYLFWPTVEALFSAASLWILGLLIILNQFVNFGGLSLLLDENSYNTFSALPIVQSTFTPICLGVLMAHAFNTPKGFHFCYQFLGKRYSPLVALMGFFIVINLPGESISGLNRLLVQIFLTILMGSVVIREDNVFRRILSFPLIARIGVVSYGIYLFHLIFLYFSQRILSKLSISGSVPVFFLTLFLTYLFCELSYRYFETPFLKLKKLFTPPREG